MADKDNSGILNRVRARAAMHADALKASAGMALREKTAAIREAMQPQKNDVVRPPERPFGRDEGGQDIKQVVWTGHTVQTPEGQRYFGAVGLSQGGYYRAAEVQVYGSDELWQWQAERHAAKKDAIEIAEMLSANRLTPPTPEPAKEAAQPAEKQVLEKDLKEKNAMAEIPEHVKARANAEVAKTGAEKLVMSEAGPSVAGRADPYDAEAMKAQRDQQRQNAVLEKQDRSPAPDKG